MKLNRSKVYGVVWGDSNVCFEQGGRMFNNKGDEVNIDGEIVRASKGGDITIDAETKTAKASK